MADNYLEKKMEEFRSGKALVRRPSVSLESLLKSAGAVVSPPQAGLTAPPICDGPLPLHPWADMASGGDTTTPAESVMPAQIQAIVRAAQLLEEATSFRFEMDEKEGIIRLLGPSSPRKYLLEAGQVIMAMRLKAAELHLCCRVELQRETAAPANPLIATLTLFK